EPGHLVLSTIPTNSADVLTQPEGDEIQYDILHSHYWLSGAAAWELHEHWGAPIVHTFHTLGKMKNVVAQKRLGTSPRYTSVAL
ncbi:MAG: glycosyltransferase, partial [Kiritimatiellia bacterium]